MRPAINNSKDSVFPKNFLWGAATSSHQVEGDNIHNDWWQWENALRLPEKSGQAIRHYELFDRDFTLAQELSHNAHRFSIEWSRIEPREGIFDEEAIRHYREVLDSLARKNITPVVTLHHFANPLWFAEKGGWLNIRAAQWFARYVENVAGAFQDKVHYWITLNEPVVLAYYGYLIAKWPPGKSSFALTMKVLHNCIAAHKRAYRVIHACYQDTPQPMIGIAHNVRPFNVCPQTPDLFCALHVLWRHLIFNVYCLEGIKKELDFIGVNYYEREFVSNDRAHGLGLWGDNCNLVHHHSDHVNQMGWGFYPDGLLEVLRWIKKYNKPVIITENGTAETDDRARSRFIIEHLKRVEQALTEGIRVEGYLYWSLLDNFEWDRGFAVRFGLVEVDGKTLERRIRPSAHVLRKIIETGRIE